MLPYREILRIKFLKFLINCNALCTWLFPTIFIIIYQECKRYQIFTTSHILFFFFLFQTTLLDSVLIIDSCIANHPKLVAKFLTHNFIHQEFGKSRWEVCFWSNVVSAVGLGPEDLLPIWLLHSQDWCLNAPSFLSLSTRHHILYCLSMWLWLLIAWWSEARHLLCGDWLPRERSCQAQLRAVPRIGTASFPLYSTGNAVIRTAQVQRGGKPVLSLDRGVARSARFWVRSDPWFSTAYASFFWNVFNKLTASYGIHKYIHTKYYMQRQLLTCYFII